MGNQIQIESECNIQQIDDVHNVCQSFQAKSNYQILKQGQRKKKNLQKSQRKSIIMPITVTQFVEFKEKRITDFYKIEGRIDGGTFGDVYKAKVKNNPSDIRAIKVIHQNQANNTIIHEINILKQLDHPNIVKIYEVFKYQKIFYIVTEYLPGGNLMQIFTKNVKCSEHSISCLFKEIISALNYLHTNKIIHRDIKPQNIIFQKQVNPQEDTLPHIKIIDFGVSIVMKNNFVSGLYGTPYFIAPEVINGIYDQKCDIWSCGVILYLLFCGKMPFRGRNVEEIYESIVHEQPTFIGKSWSNISKSSISLIIKMLNKNWKSRISAKQIMQSQWMTNKKIQHFSFQLETLHQLQAHQFQDSFIAIVRTYLASMTTSLDQRRRIAEIFQLFDTDKNGFIDRKQLVEAYKQNGNSNINIDQILNNIDTNKSGKIDFTEFLTVLSKQQTLFVQQKLLKAFDYIDKDKTGYIQIGQITFLLKTSQQNQIHQIMGKFDKNKDDKISKSQFLQTLLQIKQIQRNSDCITLRKKRIGTKIKQKQQDKNNQIKNNKQNRSRFSNIQ